MVNRRVVRKEQDTSLDGGRMAAEPGAIGGAATGDSATSGPQDRTSLLARLAEDFHVALSQCARHVGGEAVHRVRTGSRRAQAQAEAMLGEGSEAGSAFDQAARPWLRQLKKIRRAAGPVRDLDVHRTLLRKWKKAAAGAGTGDALPRQAGLLDDWLKGRRRHLVEALLRQIHKRRDRMAACQEAMLAAARRLPGSPAAREPAVAGALKDFVRTADAMPLLDSGNLHDFRKAVKKARYRAESAGGEKGSRAVAQALKQVQDAIGCWHDWLTLAEEARTAPKTVLGDDGVELTARFEEEAGRHFAAAIETAESMRGRLSGEWLALRRRPPRAARALEAKHSPTPAARDVA